MRLWSLHPKYLDSKGLVALWREALLAKNVLQGKTTSYMNHPQLNRFRLADRPIDAINQYILEVYLESVNRNYKMSKERVSLEFEKSQLTVTTGQLEYEISHLMNKLRIRALERYNNLIKLSSFDVNPLFILIEGEIEEWEVSARK